MSDSSKIADKEGVSLILSYSVLHGSPLACLDPLSQNWWRLV